MGKLTKENRAIIGDVVVEVNGVEVEGVLYEGNFLDIKGEEFGSLSIGADDYNEMYAQYQKVHKLNEPVETISPETKDEPLPQLSKDVAIDVEEKPPQPKIEEPVIEPIVEPVAEPVVKENEPKSLTDIMDATNENLLGDNHFVENDDEIQKRIENGSLAVRLDYDDKNVTAPQGPKLGKTAAIILLIIGLTVGIFFGVTKLMPAVNRYERCKSCPICNNPEVLSDKKLMQQIEKLVNSTQIQEEVKK